MPINSRTKGATGERELAKKLTETFGCEARRGQQFKGGADSPDVVTSLDGVHFECKRVERFNLYKALEQATRDAGEKVPVVCHRQSRKDWVLVVKLDDVNRLVDKIIENRNGQKK
jgi:Holliday junction resolvase